MNKCSFEIATVLYRARQETNPKIWGYCVVDGKHYTFWCHDLETFTFKRQELLMEDQKIHNKLSKEYVKVSPAFTETIITNFAEKLKQELTLARLSNSVRNE